MASALRSCFCSLALVLCLSAAHVAGLASGSLFPCDAPSTLCLDDPTFLGADNGDCSSASPSSCLADAAVMTSCPVSCGTCPPCAQPAAINEIDIIVQFFPLSDTTVSIWIDSSMDINYLSFKNVCKKAGYSIPVYGLDLAGGLAGANGLTFQPTLVAGQWSASGPNPIPPGYHHLGTLHHAGLESIGCDPGSFVLESGSAQNFESFNQFTNQEVATGQICGTQSQPCPSPAPPQPPSPPATYTCEGAIQCQDDPTFVSLSAFPCGTTDPDICIIDPNALTACQISCGTCQPCNEPEPIEDMDVIVQMIPLTEKTASIWIKSQSDVGGMQFQMFCQNEDGSVTTADVIGAFGGKVQSTSFFLMTGKDGKWLSFSLEGEALSPGYYHFTTLKLGSLPGSNCDSGNIILKNGAFSGPDGNTLSFCGTADTPCPYPPSSPPSPEPQPSPVLSCPGSAPRSGQVTAPSAEGLTVADLDVMMGFIRGSFQNDLFVDIHGNLGCLGVIADGNGDGVFDAIDTDGFYQVLMGKACPSHFTEAAGGPCLNRGSIRSPPAGCPEVFHNGDVNGDGSLTVTDVNFIAQGILKERALTECEAYVADGIPDQDLTVGDLQGFVTILTSGESCPEGFTSDVSSLKDHQGDACIYAPGP